MYKELLVLEFFWYLFCPYILKRVTRLIQAIEQYGLEIVLNTNWLVLTNRADWQGTSTSSFSVEEAEKRVRALRLPVWWSGRRSCASG